MTEALVTVTINGREATVPKETLLVEAAKQVNVEIPVFCYHPKLKPVGACRMCLVEIEKMPKLQTACTTPVADGMVIRSNSPGAVAGQNGVIELLLANHPLDCPVCDKGGECPLQDNAFKYGLGFSRMVEEKRHQDKAFPLSDRIVLDKERCIMCFRCVRFQQEIPGDEALAVIDRGAGSEIGTLTGEPFESPFSGNTIELCPVGALTSRQYRFRARPWDLTRTPSICTGCAVGCNVELHARDGRILRMVARDNPRVDDGWLCDMGRFDTLPPLSSERPTRPLIRREGVLVEATWDEALARAVELLKDRRSAVLASSAITNEAVWLLTGPLRSALPNGTVGFRPWPVAPWPLKGKFTNLPGCTRLVIVGLDPWTELPILALWLRKAVLNGGALLAIGPRNGLYRDTAAWLSVPDEQIGETLRGLLAGLDGSQPNDDVREAARHLSLGEESQQAGPAAVLAGPRAAADPGMRELLERLAARLGANGDSGMIGSPALTANGQGVYQLAPELATDDPLAEPSSTLLLVGAVGEASQTEGTPAASNLIVASNGPFEERDAVEVVFPLSHPYEQAGSLTNLEGRVQRLEPSGFAPAAVLPDWAALARLANALGASAPTDLSGIRSALAEQHPEYEVLRHGLPASGRLLAEAVVA
jgi:NADH-quinone oxidoreductase subunit G